MGTVGKKTVKAGEGLPLVPMSLLDAIKEVKDRAFAKFDESIDLDIRLAIDPKRSDQAVKGVVYPPCGLGRSVKIAVFAQGELAIKAKAAGADFVGFDDLAKEIESKGVFFDCCIATPDTMLLVGKLGRVLGPRGLMPNPRMGTVVTDVEDAVKKAKKGRIEYKSDSYGMLHCSVGRLSFSTENLAQNISSLFDDVIRARPIGLKGSRYLLKGVISSTMGPGIQIDLSSISKGA